MQEDAKDSRHCCLKFHLYGSENTEGKFDRAECRSGETSK